MPKKLSASKNATRRTSAKETIELPHKFVNTLVVPHTNRSGIRSTIVVDDVDVVIIFVVVAMVDADTNRKRGGVVTGGGEIVVMR